MSSKQTDKAKLIGAYLDELSELREYHDEIQEADPSGWDRHDQEMIYKPEPCAEKSSTSLDLDALNKDLTEAFTALQEKRDMQAVVEVLARVLCNPENLSYDSLLRHDVKKTLNDLLPENDYYRDMFKQRKIML